MKTLPALLLSLVPIMGANSAFAAGAAVTHVPITFTRMQVRVPVSVNGSEPFMLILDTGMPAMGIILRDSERAAALELPVEGADTLTGGGSGPAVAVRVAPAQRIEVGGISIPDVDVTLLPSRHLVGEADGVIGLELFARYAVRVDVDHSQLELIDKATYQPPANATNIPMRLVDNKAFIDARVSVAGGASVPVDLALDLGAGHALWLNQREPGRLAPPDHAIRTTFGQGISGKITGAIARVHKIEIGSYAFDNVVTVFPEAEFHNPGGFDFKDGFVGAGLLTRFVVTFDYASKRLVLVPGERFKEPFEFDMTGMMFANTDPTRRPIDSVLPGSPAEAAGIKAGDMLVALDGKPLASFSPEDLKRALQRDGAELRVTLERDGSRIEKTLRMRRLI